ncbi:MAG TPA: flagellar hook-associated protein FlgK [Planctomycetes bacterium]|nr:flagellar hook-associated protein FlgK [Planctomycetota bacterium]
MRGFDIGLSALRTHQRTLNTIGNNIANASTPGYHRQRVNLVTRAPQIDGAHLVGTGVDVGSIERLYDVATEAAILRNQAQLGQVGAELDVANSIEGLFTPGDSSIHANLSDFFNNLEAVANSPEVQTVRSEFLTSSENLLYQFGRLNSDLEQHRQTVISEVTDTVNLMNGLINDVADLNHEIQIARISGRQPNDLLDRRDSIVSQLTQWADVDIQTMKDGREVVLIGGATVTVGKTTDPIIAEVDSNGQLSIRLASQSRTLDLTSGRLGGQLEAVNETIPSTQDRLGEMAATIVRSIDQQYATGLPASGAYSLIQGSRGVDSVPDPLVSSGLAFPVISGELTITVTAADGRRSSTRVAIDPYTDSLTDLATALDAISGVNAVVDTATGRLTVSAVGNQKIDFAGRVDDLPDLTSYTGTAQPEFSGFFVGDTNDQWDVTFNGSGTVGVTDGLTATIRNSAGQIVANVNVGSGYEAGAPVELSDGVSLQFGNGTIIGTDTANVLVTSDPDNTGILSALGLNSLFSGTAVGNFALRKDIAASPELLAVSLTGHPGDASNIASLANLRDFRFAAFDDRTFVEELADFTADVGLEVQQLSNQKSQLEAYDRRLIEDREATSGVSADEEILKMMEMERAFQAAARFITSLDDTMDEIMRIIQ